jgi:hypothetical protein
MQINYPEITSHACMRLWQRFKLKDKKFAKAEIKRALKEGNKIDVINDFNYTIVYKEYYIPVQDGVIKTAFTKEIYEEEVEKHK